MIYYRRYIGDFQADTMALSMLEQGAYDRLLDFYYSTEKPIPLNTDRAAIICRAVTLEDRAAVQAVLEGYFERREDGWHNKRADHEIEVSRQARQNGGKGGRPTKIETGDITGIETGTITGMHTETVTGEGGGSGHPSTTNHQPRTKPLRVVADTLFGRFWDSWPSSKRKVAKAKCAEVWQRRALDACAAQIIAHVEAMKGTEQWRTGYEPSPLTYLNQRRWEDGMPSAQPRERRLAI